MARESLKACLNLLREYNEEIPVHDRFLRDLKRSIELTDEKNRREPSRTYKPSSMNCIRQSYYQITGAERDEDSASYQLIGICNSGTDTHVRIQTAVADMHKNGIDCEYADVAEYIKERPEISKYVDIVSQEGMETKLYHKLYNISFMCDGIIKYKGKYYILELKTESSDKFMKRNDVDESHHAQAVCYSMALGIDEVIFVYISRDNSAMKSFTYKVTDDMKQNLVNYILECDSYIEKKIPPYAGDDVPNNRYKHCRYCNYKTQCRKDR